MNERAPAHDAPITIPIAAGREAANLIEVATLNEIVRTIADVAGVAPPRLRDWGRLAALLGQLFLRTIFMVVVPLVVSALVVGVYELGQGRDLPGVAGRTLAYTVLLSAAAVAIGLVMDHLAPAGRLLAQRKEL